MSNNEVGFGQISKNSPYQIPGQFAIYDKVINLQMFIEYTDPVSGNVESDYFTIRSDYEIDFDKYGRYVFKRCRIKPEIRIEYKRVSESISIEVMIRITNLHLQSAASENGGNTVTKLSASGFRVKRIRAQIGYFNQFPNFENPALNLTLEDYFNLRSRTVPLYDEIDCTVLAAYPTRLPPDGETTFHCVIASYGRSSHSVQDETDVTVQFDDNTTAEAYFFNTITRKYFRSATIGPDVVRIPGTGRTVTVTNEAGKEETIVYPGAMNDITANKYGVKVHCSAGVKRKLFMGESKVPAIIPQRDNVHAALYELTVAYPSLKFVSLPNGNYIAFIYPGESASDIAAEMELQGVTGRFSELPAAYSITYSGLRSIKCPYSSLIKPFSVISFSSMYNTGNLVSYFYQPRPGEEAFVIINISVVFSTTGDENEMELLSTDKSDGGR